MASARRKKHPEPVYTMRCDCCRLAAASPHADEVLPCKHFNDNSSLYSKPHRSRYVSLSSLLRHQLMCRDSLIHVQLFTLKCKETEIYIYRHKMDMMKYSKIIKTLLIHSSYFGKYIFHHCFAISPSFTSS